MTRIRLQIIRWVSFALSAACVIVTLMLHPRGGAALGLFFSMLIFGAPGAFITLRLYDTHH